MRKKNPKEITKEELEELYIIQNLSATEVKKILNISQSRFNNLCKKFNIRKSKESILHLKRKTWSQHTHKRDLITKEELEELYIIQNKSIDEVKVILNISNNGVLYLLDKYNLHKDKEIIKENIVNKNKELYATGIPQQKFKETCLEKYGVPYPSQNKEINDKIKAKWSTGEVQEKVRQTSIERYGVENYTQTQEYKDKSRQTCLEKYGVENYTQTQEYKDRMKAQYDIIRDRVYQTQKENGTLLAHHSKQEEQIYKLLIEKFGSDNIIRQYKSQLYPFKCDFYIKSLDLYIEFQGSWCHGKVPFDSGNEIHQKLIKRWENRGTDYFLHAIKTWTISDPLKRKTAKENNLNWKEFFTIDEAVEYINSLEG